MVHGLQWLPRSLQVHVLHGQSRVPCGNEKCTKQHAFLFYPEHFSRRTNNDYLKHGAGTLRKPANIITWNAQGKRKRGRPRNSWRSDLEKEKQDVGLSWSVLGRGAREPGSMGAEHTDGLCSAGATGLCKEVRNTKSFWTCAYLPGVRKSTTKRPMRLSAAHAP